MIIPDGITREQFVAPSGITARPVVHDDEKFEHGVGAAEPPSALNNNER
jgi:hypothetical protein